LLVKSTLDNEFAGYEIEDSEVSETVEGTVYEFNLEKDETDMEVSIDTAGTVIKKETKTEEDEEDD